MFGGSGQRLSFSGSLDNTSSNSNNPSSSSSTPRLRKRSSVVEDEYFPSLLTVDPTSSAASASAEKKKDGASASAKRADDQDSFQDKFASHRRGGSTNSISSPFDFDRRRAYPRTSGSARQKAFSSPSPEEEDHYFDEHVAPPTTSLAQTSSLLFDNTSAPTTTTPASSDPLDSLAPMKSRASSFFPSSREEEWGKDHLYWVTVYGFSSSTKAYLLHLFQSFGDVLQFVDGNGNWIHVRYHTRLQAEKALSYDGKMLSDGNVMIGVKHCFASEIEQQKVATAQGLFGSCLPSRSSSSAFTAPGSSELEVDPLDTSDLLLPPRRRQDVCSRVMRFLFNWS